MELVSKLRWPATVFVFGFLPAAVVVTLFVEAIRGDAVATDFRVFYDAGRAILDGESPYPDLNDPTAVIGRSYVYPPLTALYVVPLTALPAESAGVLAMAVLVAAILAVPWVLGVRDWRCYGLLLLWPPVISAVQTASVTILLALAAALAWRFRDRSVASGAAVGVTIAVKSILWPLVIWLAATRRVASAVLACLLGIGLALASWAVVGFAGLADYPDLLRRLDDAVGEDSYTTYIVGLDLGLPSALARAFWLALGIALLAAVVVLGRRGDERRAYVLAIAASLALTPIVWLHYFALLSVVVALCVPRLGPVWFVPLALVLTPGSGHPSPFETAWTLGIAAITIALAIRAIEPELREARAGVLKPVAREVAL
jgi:hypothetical protein